MTVSSTSSRVPQGHSVYTCVAANAKGTSLQGEGMCSTCSKFPFSPSAPLKVFFIQNVNLDDGSNKVSLTGLYPYLWTDMVGAIPSTDDKGFLCMSSRVRDGLASCEWAGLSPKILPNASEEWLKYSTTLVAPGTALIKLRGQNTRACRIYFDQPVNSIRLENTTGEVQSLYPFPKNGITQLELFSRTWDKEFVVTANWVGDQNLTGKVACGWAEGGMPALDEVKGFLPNWATVTKQDDALVEALKSFSV